MLESDRGGISACCYSGDFNGLKSICSIFVHGKEAGPAPRFVASFMQIESPGFYCVSVLTGSDIFHFFFFARRFSAFMQRIGRARDVLSGESAAEMAWVSSSRRKRERRIYPSPPRLSNLGAAGIIPQKAVLLRPMRIAGPRGGFFGIPGLAPAAVSVKTQLALEQSVFICVICVWNEVFRIIGA